MNCVSDNKVRPVNTLLVLFFFGLIFGLSQKKRTIESTQIKSVVVTSFNSDGCDYCLILQKNFI